MDGCVSTLPDIDWDVFLKHCLHHPETDCVEWLGSRRGTQPVAFLRKTRGRADARVLYHQFMSQSKEKRAWKGQGTPICKTPQCLNWDHYAPCYHSKKRKRADERERVCQAM